MAKTPEERRDVARQNYLAKREKTLARMRAEYARNKEARNKRARERYAEKREARCASERARYAADIDTARGQARARYAANVEKTRGQSRGRYAKRPADSRRDKHYRGTYGITLAQVESMYLAQGAKCAICRSGIEPVATAKRKTHLDHNHVTGKVRGLLCQPCNFFIGHLEVQGSEKLELALEYLRVHADDESESDENAA